MIFLGEYKAGDSVFYAANFHNDTGTIEDPTSPEAQIRNSAGTWSALTAPAKQNSKTGHYGGTVDTTGYSVGQHVIRMAGTVATAKTTATEFCFTIVANITSDVIADTDNIQTRIPVALVSGRIDASVGSNLDKTGYSISGTKTTLDSLNDITVASIWAYAIPTLTGFPTNMGELFKFVYQWIKNKLKYDKSVDNMILYEDNGSTAKMTHPMTDSASEATRGAGV